MDQLRELAPLVLFRRALSGALLVFFLSLGHLLPSSPAAAAAPERGIGRAEIVVRQVEGLLGEITREIANSDNVYSEEVIETGPESATRMRFLDGTQISVGALSQVTLDRYIYDPEGGAGQLVMNFVHGVLEFVSGSMSHESYDLRTPFAHLSVRGTRIIIMDDIIAVTEGSTLVRLNDGRELLVSSTECLVQDRDGKWRLVVGSCDEHLSGYRGMLALLASASPPNQNFEPHDLLQRFGYVSPDRNQNQPASKE